MIAGSGKRYGTRCVDGSGHVPGCPDASHLAVAKPAPEGPVVFVDRRHIRPGLHYGEWTLCVDETECASEVLLEYAALHPEDACVGASAVETEEAR